MKVDLDEKGRMRVRAETAVESYALSHWFDMWQQRTATLHVETFERQDGVQIEPAEVLG